MLNTLLADPQVHNAVQNILSSVAVLLGALIGKLILTAGRLVTAKIQNEHNALYTAVAERLVKYAEQRFAGMSSDVKLHYVVNQIALKYPKLHPSDIDHFLEEAVVNMNAAIKAPPLNVAIVPAVPPVVLPPRRRAEDKGEIH